MTGPRGSGPSALPPQGAPRAAGPLSMSINDTLQYLTPTERRELEELLALDARQTIWTPLPGPQMDAYHCTADVLGYGGSAGSGKTDLILGKALNQHHDILIMRREAPQTRGIIDRLVQILGHDSGLNRNDGVWRGVGQRQVTVEFGSAPHPGNENRYQGRPHDLLAIDEAANFLQSQVRFLMGWVRTTRPGVRTQTLMTFNPPTSDDGRWIVPFFGPWLDKRAKRKADPGELVYVATLPQSNGESIDEFFVPPDPFVLVNGERVYNFDPAEFRPEDIITPATRTFIPGRVSDNPYLLGTGYLRQLQAMPEPLRSMLLYGDFHTQTRDDPFQIIPSEWVRRAQERWKERPTPGEMDSMGLDVARGGADNTVIATLHTGAWIAPLIVEPGTDTPDGHHVAALALTRVRDDAPIHVDANGVGASPYDLLHKAIGGRAVPVMVQAGTKERDRSGVMRFKDLGSLIWWRGREALDPDTGDGIALPPDPLLAEELCAPRWIPDAGEIRREKREDTQERLGRSPDRATAVLLALIRTPKLKALQRDSRGYGGMKSATRGGGYNPFARR